MEAVKADVLHTGSTIVSDGWTDTARRPILNFLQVVPKGAIFIDSEDTSGEVKDAEFIGEAINQRIESVGPETVNHVVTDSAAVCKAAFHYIKDKYPHVICDVDPTHGVDLFFEDVGAFPWVSKLIKQVRKVVLFILNHQATLALYRTHNNLELLKPGETRFGTNFIMMERVLRVRQALETTVTDPGYEEYLNRTGGQIRDKGTRVKQIVLHQTFQPRLEQVIACCECVLHACCMDCMHLPCTTMSMHHAVAS
jgi:hypothetical protein